MGLLNFGKKKDSNIDEYIIRENISDLENNVQKNIDDEQDIIEEDKSDYIDPDDLNFNNYDDIVDTIEENGWTCISSVAHPITIFDSEIVFPYPVKANSYNTLLEITCPPERIITICGFDDCGIDPDDFYNSPNFYQIPHFFTLRCMDNNNVDISPTTIISILKASRNEEPEKYYQEFYGDLSSIVDGRLKKKEERYYFAETIILQSGEKLIFRVHNPNIDISKIDLLMMSDLFEKDEDKSEE